MESGITNNISVEDAEKHDMTPESMFANWIALFRSHVHGRCEFTIEPNLCLRIGIHSLFGFP